jgi:hypothetical protein
VDRSRRRLATRNTVRYQKSAGRFRWTLGGRRGRMASRVRLRRSTHGSTRSNSRLCSVFQGKQQRHSPELPLMCRVCGLKWCSRSGLSVPNNGQNYGKLINFFNRNSVILLCSAAAVGNSVATSFSSRCFNAESISSEVLPVAQMMKINPNFCS